MTSNKDNAAKNKNASSLSFAILYTALRISLANLSPLTDCDEVFNYWEPMHFLVYKFGMQTWEYAPQYALRTYAYLLPMVQLCRFYDCILGLLPASCVDILIKLSSPPASSASSLISIAAGGGGSIMSNNKPLLFHLLRSTLAAITAMSELSLFSSLSTSLPSSPLVSRVFLFASFTSAGAFHASGAYLPSSTVMVLWMFSAANQLRGRDTWAILWGLIAVLAVGWPFCAVLFLTTGFWAVWKEGAGGENGDAVEPAAALVRIVKLLVRTALHAMLIQCIVMAIDYQQYGKIVSPILNIFIYNAQSGGDELYGVEPTSYYIKNLLLNLNLVALWGLISLPILLVKCIFGGEKARADEALWKKIIILCPMYIWLGIVVPRPHKEERFLFPIYPMLCVGAAVTVDELLSLLLKLFDTWRTQDSSGDDSNAKNRHLKLTLGILILLPSALLSMSRAAALSANYSSPLALYEHLYHHTADSLSIESKNSKKYVCTGGEWYRFPSSFHLPPNVQLAFLKSSFTGQLPQPFTVHGSKEESTTIQTGKFNDVNKEEMDRYLTIEQCSYVVELVDVTTSEGGKGQRLPECVEYMNSDKTGEWKEVASYNYLDADKTSALNRILYLPWGRGEDRVVHKGYTLYERVA